MRGVITAIEGLTEGVGGLAALVIIPLVLATCYEVFARYLFNAPTIWAFELGYTLTGIHFLLGGAITLKRQGHVRIDLIYGQLSVRKRAIIDIVLYAALVLPALTLIFLRLADYATQAYLSGEGTGQSSWNPPIWPFRVIIATSFLVLTLQVVAEILKCIGTLRKDAGIGEESRS